MMSTARCRIALVAIGLVLAAGSRARAQQEDPAQLLDEFVHYTFIAKPDLAAAYGQRVLGASITDSELAVLVEESKGFQERFQQALSKAHQVPELEAIAAELDRRVSDGRLDLARDPDRIDGAITMLTGTQRQKLMAREMLSAAGEYAVPRLLRVITDGRDERLRMAAGSMLVMIGRQAVVPLSEALSSLDARNQVYICRLLGEIGLPTAVPYLMQLALDNQAADDTREAASRAARAIGAFDGDLSMLFERLGEDYFDEHESLIAFPYEATNNVWFYDAFGGLEATPVPTEIFCEVQALRAAGRAIDLDPGNTEALTLFVAANLKRENELVPGSVDPLYGENKYTPAFYATVFGTRVCLDVLGIGLDRLDTPLIRDAIKALSQTTGGANLFSTGSARQPLLEALQYPDRRVQYEAALTLGQALPTQRFPGDVTVVPLLASAVRTGDESYAVVIASNEEDARVAASRLVNLSFTVIASASDLGAADMAMAGAAGVDLVLVQMAGADATEEVVKGLEYLAKTSAAPVIVVAAIEDMLQLKQAFRSNIRVKLSRARVTDAQFAEAVDEVMLRAAGGRMTEAEAEAYAIDAIMTLRDIAISGNTAYAIADAESALIQALASRQGAIRLNVADILALIDSDRAQRTLFDAALAATGDEQIELLDRVADSVKRYGNHAEQRHIDALIELIVNSGGDTAEAAARLHGALVLPPGAALELIP